MTSSERMMAALSHKEPDRTPYFEYLLLPPLACRFLGRDFIDYGDGSSKWFEMARERGWEKAVRQYAVDRVELAYILGHDTMYILPNPLPPSDIREIPHQRELAVLPDDPSERVALRNEQMEKIVDFLPDEHLYVYECLREEMRKRDMDLPLISPACTHGIWTDTDLMQTMLLEPETAHKHFALATRRALQLTGRYIESCVEQIMVGGDFAGNRPIISPEAYKTFIVPEIRKVVGKIHDMGCYALNASDGNLWPVIDDYLTACEVDGCIEIDMSAGMDLLKLKTFYGDKITLYGNMDCGNVLSFSTPEEIRRITVDCIEAGWGNGGHIFCSSNAIASSIPFENYIAMVNAYREYFSLPVLTF